VPMSDWCESVARLDLTSLCSSTPSWRLRAVRGIRPSSSRLDQLTCVGARFREGVPHSPVRAGCHPGVLVDRVGVASTFACKTSRLQCGAGTSNLRLR
jgi:hypothetical protein